MQQEYDAASELEQMALDSCAAGVNAYIAERKLHSDLGDIPTLLEHALENLSEEREGRFRVLCEVLNTEPKKFRSGLIFLR
ncbi:MAG: hypothetical protein EA428_08000 [Spirochaetaceae bacterium]|nr:MAG: hypothetical protein EA428_08000 [Spirochaetaceae bacterium]